ncbi:hypothetical protein Scep_015093 [Stephania cephalantha]|uniref:Uncharacterized protein n=1 Tax=Stephania cephalantha TaxID=152367 RepID=A0AAP0P027_9MAGN
MNLNVEITSRDTIKPSSPTQPHLSPINLSLIDQFSLNAYVPLLLFYSNSNATSNPTTKIQSLTNSLSKALTKFYPLAGTINGDNLTIECNDRGVLVLVARVTNCHLSQVLSCPDLEQLDQLLPTKERDGKSLFAIQITSFVCGGMVVGVYINHKIGDASSLSFFLNNWASIARADEVVIEGTESPVYGFEYLFQRGQQVPMLMGVNEKRERLASRKFVFHSSTIAALQAKHSIDKAPAKSPSRVMAVTAFLWRIAMNTEEKQESSISNSIKPTFMEISINLRGRMDPPLSDHHFGNLSVVTTTPISNSTTVSSGSTESELVEHMEGLVRGIDSDYIKRLQSGDEYLVLIQSMEKAEEMFARGAAARYTMSSWCGFPFYGVDFGWGRPLWLTLSAVLDYKNLFLLTDTSCGEGVEALVVLSEEHMERFVNYPEIVALFGLED